MGRHATVFVGFFGRSGSLGALDEMRNEQRLKIKQINKIHSDSQFFNV